MSSLIHCIVFFFLLAPLGVNSQEFIYPPAAGSPDTSLTWTIGATYQLSWSADWTNVSLALWYLAGSAANEHDFLTLFGERHP